MKTLHVNTANDYDIRIEEGILDRCGEEIAAVARGRRCAVITDSTVRGLYADRVGQSLLRAGFTPCLCTFPAGERSKNLTTYGEILEFLAANKLTRSDCIVALGGGVTGDMAGFAAATYLRGIDYVQIPTTLLSQVDSSVGGKTAIDLAAGKNLAGAFYQPRLVLMDPSVLRTLPDGTFADGMAEVIKVGCIWDRSFFEFLAARPGREAVMGEIGTVLHTCCDCKRQVVEQDERDVGLRMILNFGHTLGHAYELAGRYVEWSHGEAVAAGMCAAAQIGVQVGLTPPEIPGRISDLCASFGLPAAISCTMEEYAAAVGLDKKCAGEDISLILLEDLGKAVVYRMCREDALAEVRRFAAGRDTDGG